MSKNKEKMLKVNEVFMFVCNVYRMYREGKVLEYVFLSNIIT